MQESNCPLRGVPSAQARCLQESKCPQTGVTSAQIRCLQEWYGSATRIVREWYGSSTGMVREWYESGTKVANALPSSSAGVGRANSPAVLCDAVSNPSQQSVAFSDRRLQFSNDLASHCRHVGVRDQFAAEAGGRLSYSPHLTPSDLNQPHLTPPYLTSPFLTFSLHYFTAKGQPKMNSMSF